MYSTCRGPVNVAIIHDPPVALAHDATTLLQRLIRLNTVNPPGNERAAQELLRG